MPRALMITLAGAALMAVAAVRWLLPPAPPTPPPLTVGVVEWPGFYALLAGAVDGGWTAEGVEVRVIAFADNPSVNAALRRGEVDVVAGAACDALLMRSQGTLVRIIGALDTSDGADVILARPGVTRLGQTPDQRIAFEGVNSFSHLFVLDALDRLAIPETAIIAQDLPATEVPKALLDGRLDAGHTWGPLAEAAKAQGCQVIVRAGDHPGVITDVMMTRQDVIDRRPEDLHRFVQGAYRLQAGYRGREPELLAQTAKFLSRDVSALLPVTGSVTLLDREDSLRRLTLFEVPGSLLQILERQRIHLARRGQFPEDIPIAEVLEPRFLMP